MNRKIIKLQEILNINFKNTNLLVQNITHKSYDKKNNYEKLEFLGDRVLGLTISRKLIDLYPDEKEGILDKKLASLVNKNVCYEVGKNMKLQDFIYINSILTHQDNYLLLHLITSTYPHLSQLASQQFYSHFYRTHLPQIMIMINLR